MTEVTIDDFLKLDLRIGTILNASPLEKAHVPAIKMEIDFGDELGVKQSSAQITQRYTPDEMIGKQIIAIVNFPPRRVAGFRSEVLVIGATPESGDVVLLNIDQPVPNGTKIA